ncbi:hypothetical protein M378DRAFT_167652 [Amanita muscaria Koide BX008]|uniref:Secreted protein n=1 Tax=Amanita muscaria (strain Koide BX008) TaxID=946122 RepID=A0A0C2WWV6_AMAMK|nr:hypothetical protein M378DRAFT_167652 [Amanita muscaria Koide BX008]
MKAFFTLTAISLLLALQARAIVMAQATPGSLDAGHGNDRQCVLNSVSPHVTSVCHPAQIQDFFSGFRHARLAKSVVLRRSRALENAYQRM